MNASRSTGKVLVLGDDTRSFLTVIRSLGRRGLEVHTAWAAPHTPASASRYVRAHHSIPAPTSGSSVWIEPLRSLALAEQFDLILPCDDPRIVPLQQHRSRLVDLPLHLLGERVFQIVSDKYASTQLARDLGLNIPRTELLTTLDRATHILETFSPPLVLKPISSFTAANLNARHVVRKARSLADACSLLVPMLGQGPVLVQENVPGRGTGLELLAKNGRTLVAFQHLRVHEPLHGGGSSYRTSIPLHQDLLQASRVLIAALRYTGVAMIEFKLDPTSSRWTFMEINGRFWGSLPLAVACGADFPAFLYDMLVHGRDEFPQHFRHGLFARNLTQDVEWLCQNARADRTDPTLLTLPLRTVFAELRHVVQLRECNDTFVRDDLRPGLLELAALGRHVARVARSKLRLRLLAAPLQRRRSRHRLLAALHRANAIVFVCAGNICRSPFAEGYARTVFDSPLRISSLGLLGQEGRPSPAEAISLAHRSGLDLSMHRSRRATLDELQGVDLVFVFDEHTYRLFLERFPSLRSRVFLLAQLELTTPLMIDDPWGQPTHVFERVFASIRQALDTAASVLSVQPVRDDPIPTTAFGLHSNTTRVAEKR